jgi:hypothetical protein
LAGLPGKIFENISSNFPNSLLFAVIVHTLNGWFGLTAPAENL